MAMQKAYERINWENYPSINTPVNEENLNRLDKATDEIDGRVITLDTTKFDKTEAAGLFKDVSLNSKTGVITFTTYSGAVKTIDTLLEKIAINFDFNEETQKIIINLEDGTVKEIDISAFIKPNEFLESETVAWIVDGQTVKAIVKEGSIEEKHLRPNYLAEIKVEAAQAEAARIGAETAQAEAKKSQTAAATSATQSAASAKESADSATASAGSATTATEQATSASNSAQAAKTSEANAATSATTATTQATAAQGSATAAATSAANASTQATNAKNSATQSAASATTAKSYAEGGTGSRDGENTDNAKEYARQAKESADKAAEIVAGDYVPSSQKGMPNGVATLDAGGKVPTDQLPDNIGKVQSVNGQTGTVVLTASNVGALPLAGGTMTGTINNSLVTSTFLQGNQGKAIINSTASGGSYVMLDKMKSTNGVFTDGVYQTRRLFQYTADSTVSAGNNYVTKSVTILDESGNSSFPGTVTAPTFSGKATTAGTADKVAHALTFTGGASGSYDGSTAQTVAIPTTLPANGGNANTANSATTAETSNHMKIVKLENTDFRTYMDNNANIHHANNEEFNVFRFFISNGDYSAKHCPCVDSHIMSYSIDNNTTHQRFFAFDIRTNDIYTCGKSNGTWSNWVKVIKSTDKVASAGTADKVAHALTFTGAVAGNYDGSVAKSVAIPKILNVLNSNDTASALSAAQGKALNDKFGTLTFGKTTDGKWGYRVGGADPVIPFKTGGGDVTIIYMPEFITDPKTPYLANNSTLTFTDENYKIVFEDDTACDLLLSEIPDTAFIGIRLSTDNNGYILQVSEMKSNFSAVLPAFVDGGFSLTMSGSWPTSPIFCQIAPILFAKTETFPAGKQYSGMLKMVEKST